MEREEEWEKVQGQGHPARSEAVRRRHRDRARRRRHWRDRRRRTVQEGRRRPARQVAEAREAEPHHHLRSRERNRRPGARPLRNPIEGRSGP